jgi:hypothetical protein
VIDNVHQFVTFGVGTCYLMMHATGFRLASYQALVEHRSDFSQPWIAHERHLTFPSSLVG